MYIAVNRDQILLPSSNISSRVLYAVQSNHWYLCISSARQNMQIHPRTHVITLEQVLVVDEVHNVSRIQPRQKGHIVLQARQLKLTGGETYSCSSTRFVVASVANAERNPPNKTAQRWICAIDRHYQSISASDSASDILLPHRRLKPPS